MPVLVAFFKWIYHDSVGSIWVGLCTGIQSLESWLFLDSRVLNPDHASGIHKELKFLLLTEMS